MSKTTTLSEVFGTWFFSRDIYCSSFPQYDVSYASEVKVISKQEVSAHISCWVTFDPAKSLILPGWNMLCTYAYP